MLIEPQVTLQNQKLRIFNFLFNRFHRLELGTKQQYYIKLYRCIEK